MYGGEGAATYSCHLSKLLRVSTGELQRSKYDSLMPVLFHIHHNCRGAIMSLRQLESEFPSLTADEQQYYIDLLTRFIFAKRIPVSTVTASRHKSPTKRSRRRVN
jgi:hypothetical protein